MGNDLSWRRIVNENIHENDSHVREINEEIKEYKPSFIENRL